MQQCAKRRSEVKPSEGRALRRVRSHAPSRQAGFAGRYPGSRAVLADNALVAEGATSQCASDERQRKVERGRDQQVDVDPGHDRDRDR